MRHPVFLFCFVVVSSACVAGKIFKKSDLEAAAKHGTCSSCKADAPEGGFGVKQKRRGADGPMIPNAPTTVGSSSGTKLLGAGSGAVQGYGVSSLTVFVNHVTTWDIEFANIEDGHWLYDAHLLIKTHREPKGMGYVAIYINGTRVGAGVATWLPVPGPYHGHDSWPEGTWVVKAELHLQDEIVCAREVKFISKNKGRGNKHASWSTKDTS